MTAYNISLWSNSSSIVIAVVASLVAIGGARAAEPFPGISGLKPQAALPDPLLSMSGERVADAKQWREKRRPELQQLFQHYMYGPLPKVPKLSFTEVRVDPLALGGKATKSEVVIQPDHPDAPAMSMLLVIPNGRSKPAPVFVGLNFGGNHTVLADPSIAISKSWFRANAPGVKDNRATEAGRGQQIDTWSIARTIERGYAVATMYYGDIDPDDAQATAGLQKYFPGAPTAATTGANRGSISAWAWGVHRMVDYLATRTDIDQDRIAVMGHSRLGKTALLAGAFDERIDLVIPHQAGCGGTAPSRGTVGESVKRINTSFPHWFNAEFKTFNDDPARLPFDQHALVALCAPRPVLLSNAQEDQWANPDGQFEVLVAADPVYRLLGVDGVGSRTRPEIGKLLTSRLGYFIRDGKHSTTPEDWKIFLDFADKQFAKP